MRKEQNNSLIEFFKCTTLTNKSGRIDFNEMNSIAVPAGYFVTPEACNNDVLEFVKSATIDVNATFYKEWNDVISKTREELLFDQMLHYATTYGTGFTIPPYIPNDGPDDVPEYAKLKVITAVTDDELLSRCLEMVNSGIALDTCTLDVLCSYISEYVRNNGGDYRTVFNFDDIKNREARCFLYACLGINPESPIELLRYIVYFNTGNTLLINNKDTLSKLRISHNFCFSFSRFGDDALKSLSTIFYRYKRIFLAMKACKENAPYINRIRRYAKHYHKPMSMPLFNDILNNHELAQNIKQEQLKELSAFKAVKIIQAIRERRLANFHSYKLYVIRNKKVFLKPITNTMLPDDEFYRLESVLYQHVVNKVKENTKAIENKTFRMPERIELGVPSSEKTFIGNYPFGTKVRCGLKNFIGVNWNKDSGWSDLDLHFYNMDGEHIGWNADFRDDFNTVVFSGDMTCPNPTSGQASEVMMTKNRMPDGIFVVTNYCYPSNTAGCNVRSRVFVATTENSTPEFNKGFMVDPNDVLLEGVNISNMKHSIIGLFEDNEFLVSSLSCSDAAMLGKSNRRVRGAKSRGAVNIIDALKLKSHSFMSLRDVLEAAGFEEAKDGEDAGLDFTELTKDGIIKLLK